MSKTIVIQIGNTDDKLSQRAWSNFVSYLHAEFDHRSPAVDFHFFGFSPTDAYWQNCCMVFNVDHEGLGYENFEMYLNDLRFILGNAARRYKQDSIALLVGETEFIPYNYETKEIQDALSGNSRKEGGEEDSQEGYTSEGGPIDWFLNAGKEDGQNHGVSAPEEGELGQVGGKEDYLRSV